MEPQDRIGLARLTQWAFDGVDLTPLRNQLLAQSLLHGGNGCLMDLSVIDQLQGRREEGLKWQARALEGERVFSTNRRGEGQKRLLVFAEPSDMGGNTPIEFLLDGSGFEILTYYPNLAAMEKAQLPDHDVAFCAVPADAPGAWAFHAGVRQLMGERPVLNLPEALVSLDRDALGQGVGPVPGSAPGLRFPKTERLPRACVGAAEVGPMPWVIRPVGSHAGKGLERIDSPAELTAYLERRAESEFHVSAFIDYASPADGQFRKYRVVFVGGRAFPCHMAIADRWDLWYLNAGMEGSTGKRREEAAFMDGFDAGFATRHRRALRALSSGIGLDYFGIDCAEDAQGNLVVFEADNALIVHDMDPQAIFPYKSHHMRRIFAAFEAMLHREARENTPEAGMRRH